MPAPAAGLDEVLAASDPHAGDLDRVVLASALALVETTRDAATATSRHRRRLWIPAVSIAALLATAGTGAAVATDFFRSWPVHFEIAGEVVDKVVDADVVIPIEYTTESGVHVSCTYALAYVWGETSGLHDFVSSHDWSGLGQRAYEEHIARPFYPSSVTRIDEDGTRTELTPEEIRADGPVFSHAIDVVFTAELPAELRDDEYLSQGHTDCDGAGQ